MKLKKKNNSGVLKHDILREFEISKSTYYRFIVREHVLLLKNLTKLKFLLIIFYVWTVFILFWLKRNSWILYWHATLDTALFVYHLTAKWPCPILGTLHRAIPTIGAPVYFYIRGSITKFRFDKLENIICNSFFIKTSWLCLVYDVFESLRPFQEAVYGLFDWYSHPDKIYLFERENRSEYRERTLAFGSPHHQYSIPCQGHFAISGTRFFYPDNDNQALVTLEIGAQPKL